MKIIKSYCTNSDCYRMGAKIRVKGLMLHSVGCPQPKASAFAGYWNQRGQNACVHAVLEPGGNVLQLLPWEHRGWHAGGRANDTHIGVEMTEPDTIAYTGGAAWKEKGDGKNTKKHVEETYKVAVELFAYLCNKFKLDPMADGVIISHSEGYERGIASCHGDVKHLWDKFGHSMDQFRRDVYNAVKGPKEDGASKPAKEAKEELYRVRKTWKDEGSQKGAFAVLDNAISCCNRYNGYSVFDGSGKVVYAKAAKKTVKEVALEVWQGKWGNGAERKKALEEAGYDYDKVHAAVAKLKNS